MPINYVIVFALLSCSSKPTHETQAAILTLKGLNSKLNVGINLVGYADELREAKVVVDQALESDSESQNNQVMEQVMDLHLAALKLWRCDNTDDDPMESIIKGHAKDECRNNVYETVIFPLSPTLQKEIEPKKSIRNSYFPDSYYYDFGHDIVLQVLWELAEEELNSLGSK
jgi:hypothetical protein